MIKINLKPICLVLSLLVILVLAKSCVKDSNLTDDNIQFNTPSGLVNELLMSQNTLTNSISYSAFLSNDERYQYVYNKVLVTASLLDLTDSQSIIVDEFLQNINPKIYLSNSREKEIFSNQFVTSWLPRAISHFSKDEISVIFASYYTPQQASDIIRLIAKYSNENHQFTTSSLSNEFCGEHELYNECGPLVEATLDNPDPFPIPGGCVAGCFCKPPYVRQYPGGPCVPLSSGGGSSGGGVKDCNCKSKNSVFTLCGGLSNANEKCVVTNCKGVTFCGIALSEDCDGECREY